MRHIYLILYLIEKNTVPADIAGKQDLDKGVPPVGGSGALLVSFP